MPGQGTVRLTRHPVRNSWFVVSGKRPSAKGDRLVRQMYPLQLDPDMVPATRAHMLRSGYKLYGPMTFVQACKMSGQKGLLAAAERRREQRKAARRNKQTGVV